MNSKQTSPSDYGALLAAYSRTAAEVKQLKGSKARRYALGTLLVALASSPLFVELVKEPPPPPPPAATKQDVEAIRKDIASLRDYLRSKHHADEQWRRVVGSAIDRMGYRVQGMPTAKGAWQSTNAHAQEWVADSPDYPLPP